MSVETSAWHIRVGVAAPGYALALALCIALSACSDSSLTHSAASKTAAAQPAAAVAGYVYDSRLQALRPVYGSLGAAHLEGPLAVSGLRSAVPCSSHSFAIASDTTGAIFSIALPSGQQTALADPVAKDQRIVLSPSCTNVLVYSPSLGSGMLIGNVLSAPHPQPVSLSASGNISGAAVGDNGTILFGARAAAGSTSLLVLPSQVTSSGAQPVTVQSLQKLGGLAFVPGSDTALVADSAANVVYLGSQLSAKPAFSALATAAQGVSNPGAVAASGDGHYAYIANVSNILRVDLNASSPPLPIACHCTPTEFLPLAGNASYQLTDPAAGLIFALSGDGQAPHTVFVPTDNVRSTQGGAQ